MKQHQPKQLTILVAATNAVGHYNACTGATKLLLDRGHKVIFVLESAFAGSRAKLGFTEHVYKGTLQCSKGQNPGQWMAELLLNQKVIGPHSPLEKTQNMVKFLWSPENLAEFTCFDAALKVAIKKYRPDLIYFDSGCLMPAIAYSGIPWVKNVSTNPGFFTLDDDLPPGGSGLPFNDRTGWPAFQEIRKDVIACRTFSKHFLQDLGYKPYADDRLLPETQSLTVYSYPEELNYPSIQNRNWYNMECFNKRTDPADTVALEALVPVQFLEENLDGQYSGKLIYVSMGTMGSVDLVLMQHLVEVLGQTNHKYIVSQGLRASEYNLARNMYGSGYLPQIQLLRHVDLVISHGGNNTVCEAFAEGKPMIILSLFADQIDNAQRLDETEFGVRLDAYKFTIEQMTAAIDKLLYDENLHKKLQAASERIQSSKRHIQLAEMIESLVPESRLKRLLSFIKQLYLSYTPNPFGWFWKSTKFIKHN